VIAGSSPVNFSYLHVTSGTGGMTFQNTSGCTLDGTNTYSGPTEVQTGTLSVTGFSLGATNAGTTVRAGATLNVSAVASIAEPLVLEGALVNSDDANIWSGPIALNGTNVQLTVVAGSLTVSGTISGMNGLTAHSFDQLRFAGTNTYTGVTRVAEGVLLVDGWQSSSPILLDGGTLGGTGTVGVIMSSATGGALNPGSSPGILNCGNVTLNAATTNIVELNGTAAGTGYDQVNVNGTVNLNNSVLKMVPGFTPTVGNSFTIINNDGADPVVGTFSGLPQGALFTNGGALFSILYTGGDGNDVVLYRGFPPARLTGIAALSNGTKLLQGLGLSNLIYSIQAASNLNPIIQWSNIGTSAANSGGVFSFTDTNAALFPMRFYRALSP
jgi:autotransporter-associated beta strand protein